MLLSENGPFEVFAKLRKFLGTDEDGFGGIISYKYEITICVYCLSVWVAALLFLVPNWVLIILSASTGVIFLEKLHDKMADNQ